MKRWHDEEMIAQKELQTYRSFYWGWRRRLDFSPKLRQAGRYRKRSAFDCGRTQCGSCHYDKFPCRHKTKQEIRSDYSFKEQLGEIK